MSAARFSRSLPLLACLLLGACATGPRGLQIDDSVPSANQDSRAQLLVLHYTVGNFESALKTLTQPNPGGGEVSAHYLVRDEPVRIYRLVDESRRAWHAGVSRWKSWGNLNAASIGIEIVNPGRVDTPDGPRYMPFPQAQVDEVIRLCQDIVARHRIRPDRILGHSDIQPLSKQDPGPAFPWKQLWAAGLIPWPDEALAERLRPQYEQALPDAVWFQQKLAQHGFGLSQSGLWDAETRK
ncbi:MAG TPA: N-acetylmuramoyl-L-alanine amidase, partial [Burkholderiaceae bacterium]|nr:N-acetylmuramoyl-L-alanine amidase [Burkholderiaceae bacterium]